MRTAFTDRYQIEHPIASAGMGFISTPPLAAAVSNAGGFGVLANGGAPPEVTRRMIAATRQLTDRPFGINFIVEKAMTTDAHIEACCDARPRVVSFHWNLPQRDWVHRLKSAGCDVWFQCSSIDIAHQAIALGVDLIIAQSSEAGGHTRGESAMMTLLPAMVHALGSVPVLAAGGIADGRGLAAALCLGAAGASVGTRFLATHESHAHDEYKRRVVESKEGDTQITHIFGPEWPDGRMRVLRNRVVREPDAKTPATIGKTVLGQHEYAMPKFSAILPIRETTGDFEEMCLAAGESAALIYSISSAADVVWSMSEQAEATLSRLCP
jgi:enoyl-[acyl-carrier protein] reductase II